MKKLSLLMLLALSHTSILAFSQEIVTDLKNYNWEENGKFITLDSADDQNPEVIILFKSYNEYVFEDKNFIFYTLEHRIIKLNTDEAIAQNNTISISMNNTSELVNIKVRTISKEGKITITEKSNIKEIQNDENNRASRMFAIEGIEKGCEIEFFYIVKSSPDVCGGLFLQYESPIKEVYFQLSAPDHLLFKFKGYNDFPALRDTIIENNRIYFARMENIPGLMNEVYSNYAKSRMRVEYKLAVNLSKSRKEIYTWSDFVQYKYSELNTLTKNEQKAAGKLFKSMNINETTPVDSKVKAIENYIKTNILLQDVYDDENSTLNNIIQHKYGNKNGIIKLYAALFKLANVGNQLVVTSNREKLPFDGAFESWRYLNNYLFYIPSTGHLLTPEESNFRYPMIPSELTSTEGLFFKEVKV